MKTNLVRVKSAAILRAKPSKAREKRVQLSSAQYTFIQSGRTQAQWLRCAARARASLSIAPPFCCSQPAWWGAEGMWAGRGWAASQAGLARDSQGDAEIDPKAGL